MAKVREVPDNLFHRELWAEYWQSTDTLRAEGALIEAYLPYVRKLLGRMMIRLPSHVKMEDLLNAALIGLHEAITRFNPDSGATFEAFAGRRVKGAVLDELRLLDPLTRSRRDRFNRIQEVTRELAMENDEYPSDEEVAEAMDMTTEGLRLFVENSQPWLSLDVPVGSSSGGMSSPVLLGDLLSDDVPTPDMEVEKEEARGTLRQAFRKLPSREQKILYLYYYEDLRLREIAELFELTEARVCQIHAMAVTKLKAELTKLENAL